MKVKFTLLRSIMARADYLLHLIAGAAIAALVLAIAIHFLPWGSALAIAATAARSAAILTDFCRPVSFGFRSFTRFAPLPAPKTDGWDQPSALSVAAC